MAGGPRRAASAREGTRAARDELARQRREVPWVPVQKEYRFQTDVAVNEAVKTLCAGLEAELCEPGTRSSRRRARAGSSRAGILLRLFRLTADPA